MAKLYKYWLFASLLTLAASFYPLYMGFKVISDMLSAGSVPKENFPKYIIPYTPIAIALLAAVLLMPLFVKFTRKFSTLIASLFSVGVFFIAELLFESKVIVSSVVDVSLESWQMFMCYIPPQNYVTRTWTAVDVLMGEYSPVFKLHFYLISLILIISLVNAMYGFAKMLLSGDKTRLKALIIQLVCAAVFLGLCILACFTAFFRDGEIKVSPLSAFLMCFFFVALGLTAGSYVASFSPGKRKALSFLLPCAAAALLTLAMYIGEMFLLSGNLYRFGEGFFFEALPLVVLAPVDIFVIAAPAALTAVVCAYLNKKPQEKSAE